MNRRGFLGSILAAATAPAIVRADSLMRIVPCDTIIYRRPIPFDLGVGAYDVTVEAGPSWALERVQMEEQLRQLIAYARSDAEFMAQLLPRLYEPRPLPPVMAFGYPHSPNVHTKRLFLDTWPR